MNGYAVWLLWIGGFGLQSVASLTRLLTGRGRLSAVSLGAYLPFLLVSLVGVGLGVYQLLTTSPTRLAAPVEGALLVEGVAGACLVVGLAAREAYIWSNWRLTSRGARLISQEQYAQALKVYDRLRKRRIYRATALAGKASALLGLGHFDEAISCADEALHLAPRDAQIWMIKSQALLALRLDSEAVAATERGAALAPRNGALWATHGVALSRLGRLAKAREAAERALTWLGTKDPTSWRATAQATIALALTAEGRPEEALDEAEQAIASAPDVARTYLAKALALERLDRAEEMRAVAEQGISHVERFLSTNPERPDYMRLKAQFLQLLGRELETVAEGRDAWDAP